MNAKEYEKLHGFKSPEDKYNFCKKKLDGHPLINRIGRTYRQLKRYYEGELKRFESED